MNIVPSSPNPRNPFQEFDFHGHAIRVVVYDHNPYFVALDVCKALNLNNVTKALYGLKVDEVRLTVGKPFGGADEMNVITESGLYRLVFRSNKGEAEEFRLWIFNEVLPQITRTGNYINPNTSALDIAEQMVITMRQQEQKLATLQWRQDTVEANVQQIDGRVTKLEKRPVKGYATVPDYAFEIKRETTVQLVEVMTHRAIELSHEQGYAIRELEGGLLSFDVHILKQFM